MTTRTSVYLAGLLACLLAACAARGGRDALPQVSHDGLRLQPDTELRAVYLKPGATLEQYDRLAILECFVSFKKDWQRDYNEDVVGLNRRVTAKDMKEIRRRVADEFLQVFTKELQTKGGYEIVDHAAKDVLVLRPAIINLIVNAPDTMSPGMSTTIVASAGEMTLYLELYDSLTNDIIARIIDPREGNTTGMAEIGGAVNNKAEADRILRHWADILRRHLDEAKRAKSATGN